MLKLSDEKIVDQLKIGNTCAFKVLYDDFEKITGFIRQNSGSEDDAREIFHESLIILYEKITKNEFKLKSKLSTYLYSVCKNLWLYHLREKKPQAFETLNRNNEFNQVVEDIAHENDHEKDTEEKLEMIVQKLNKLKEPCYSILMMFYFKKMSYQLIAKELNYKTEKVVKNQKYRCLQKFRELLPENFTDKY